MSKAILVIDMPKNCFECEHRIKIDPDNYFCLLLNSVFEERFEFIEGKRKECPVKPIPKSINEEKALDITKVKDHTYLNGVVDGFSICLNEILGDEK